MSCSSSIAQPQCCLRIPIKSYTFAYLRFTLHSIWQNLCLQTTGEASVTAAILAEGTDTVSKSSRLFADAIDSYVAEVVSVCLFSCQMKMEFESCRLRV